MRMQTGGRAIVGSICATLLSVALLQSPSYAKTPQEIDASADAALDRFTQQVSGADAFLRDAKGVLVFPDVVQAGIGVGGQYGQGALRIGGRTVAYYSLASASIGFQLGAQKKDVILVFLQDHALRDFQARQGWQVGVDGSVVFVNLGAHASIDSATLDQPIVGFVVGQEGLMYNLTLQGSKISKLQE